MTIDELGQIAATIGSAAGHPEIGMALNLIGAIRDGMEHEGREHTTDAELAIVEERVAAARARAKATA